MEAFRERGFEATSMSELTDRTGVQKASLYGAFGDKRAIYLAALARYSEEALGRLRERLAAPGPVRGVLRGFFSGIARGTCGGGAKGCLCVNSAMEFAARDAEIAKLLRAHTEKAEAVFRELLVRGVAEGELAADTDVVGLARFLQSSLLGLTVSSMTSPGEAVLLDIVDGILAAAGSARARSKRSGR